MSRDIILALLAGIFFALYQLLNRKASLRIALTNTMVTLLTTCLVTVGILVVILVGPVSSWSLSLAGIVYFSAAGFFHFVLGFTGISLSQKQVGAGRTGALVGTVPIFAAAVGWIFLGEKITLVNIVSISVIVIGATFISTEKINGNERKGTPIFGFGAAAAFSVSAAFIRTGLNTGIPPLVGLLIGFVTALLCYIPLRIKQYIGHRGKSERAVGNRAVAGAYILQISAGVAIALAMWFRYIATATVPIAVVTALGRVNIPTILVLSPIVLKTPIDTTSLRLWGGASAVLVGTGMLAFL